MKKTKLYLFAMVLILALGSCAKDGADGAIGPEGRPGAEGKAGARGEQGIEGKQGIPGTDGKMIYYGDTPPTASVGEEGDFYIDKKNSNLYGPKTATSWGAASSMKGATGDRGATGAAGAKGDKGDTGDRGATGAAGAKGDKGDTGDRGATGAAGAKGDKGDTGDRGTTGAAGAKGDKGDTGDRGATGAAGAKGDAGAAGSQFLSGTTDPDNSLGKTGDFYFNRSSGNLFGPKTTTWAAGVNLKGPKGDKGDKGDKGATGDKGEDGKDGNANVTTQGWTIITTPYWKNMVGVDGLVFTRPGDIQLRVVDKIFYVNSENITGAVLVYSDRGQGINMLPFKSLVTIGGYSGTVEFRFVYDEKWLYIVAALIDGTWSPTYMEQTYLPAIKWKLVLIPEILAKAQADALTKLNLTNYEVVSAHFDLKD